MSHPPAIRGFVCRMILEGARALPTEKQQRVLPRVPEQTLALIDATARMGWVPIEESMKLTEALHAALGTRGFRQFLSEQADHIASYPMLQSVFDSAVRLLGLTPQALLKWCTHAWEQAFRGCGRLVYQPRPEPTRAGRVEFYVGTTRVGTDTSAPYTYGYNTRLQTNGAKVITAKAYASWNNASTSAPVNVTFNNDLTAPTSSVTSPASGATVSGIVQVTCAASDDWGVVSKVELWSHRKVTRRSYAPAPTAGGGTGCPARAARRLRRG